MLSHAHTHTHKHTHRHKGQSIPYDEMRWCSGKDFSGSLGQMEKKGRMFYRISQQQFFGDVCEFTPEIDNKMSWNLDRGQHSPSDSCIQCFYWVLQYLLCYCYSYSRRAISSAWGFLRALCERRTAPSAWRKTALMTVCSMSVEPRWSWCEQCLLSQVQHVFCMFGLKLEKSFPEFKKKSLTCAQVEKCPDCYARSSSQVSSSYQLVIDSNY